MMIFFKIKIIYIFRSCKDFSMITNKFYWIVTKTAENLVILLTIFPEKKKEFDSLNTQKLIGKLCNFLQKKNEVAKKIVVHV